MKPNNILSKVPPIEPLKPGKGALTALANGLRATAKRQATEARKSRNADIKKTAKFAKSMGLQVTAINVSGDGFTISTATDSKTAAPTIEPNEWD